LATVTWFNPKSNTLLMRMNYELICKPTNWDRSRGGREWG